MAEAFSRSYYRRCRHQGVPAFALFTNAQFGVRQQATTASGLEDGEAFLQVLRRAFAAVPPWTPNPVDFQIAGNSLTVAKRCDATSRILVAGQKLDGS